LHYIYYESRTRSTHELHMKYTCIDTVDTSNTDIGYGALALLVWHQEEHPACKI